jgi:hypothetical protein
VRAPGRSRVPALSSRVCGHWLRGGANVPLVSALRRVLGRVLSLSMVARFLLRAVSTCSWAVSQSDAGALSSGVRLLIASGCSVTMLSPLHAMLSPALASVGALSGTVPLAVDAAYKVSFIVITP